MQKLNLIIIPLFMFVALGSVGFIIADKIFGYNYFEERNKRIALNKIYKNLEKIG